MSSHQIHLSHRKIFEIAGEYSKLEKNSGSRKDGSWQVRRFAQEDWILNIRVYRYFRRQEKFQVALFRAADHEKYVKYSGVMGGLIFLLSDAYNQAGKMAVEFSGPRGSKEATIQTGFEPCIPECILNFAMSRNLHFEKNNTISDLEGRQLYLELTGLNSGMLDTLKTRGIDEIQLCFVIQRNIWTNWQSEHICNHAYAPEKIFLSKILPEDRLQFLTDMTLLRSVMMAERAQLQIKVEKKSPELPPIKSLGRSKFQIDNEDAFILPCSQFVDLKDTVLRLYQDLSFEENSILVLPSDFHQFLDDERKWILDFASNRKMHVKTIADRIVELDNEIAYKLILSSSTRKPPPIKAD